MAQTAGMRATSLAASAALLGAAVMVALTFNYELRLPDIPFPNGSIVNVEQEAPPPPPEERPASRQVVRDPIAEPIDIIDPFDATTELADLTLPPSPFGTGEPAVQTVTSPHWLRRPTDLDIYYPRRALERGVEGDVLLDCRVTTTGFLRCSVVSETPAGQGFSDAALRIAGDHQMRPATRDGLPVEGRYRMRVPFRVE